MVDFYRKLVGKYTSPMDPMGVIFVDFRLCVSGLCQHFCWSGYPDFFGETDPN